MFLISGTRHIAVIGLGEKEKPKNDLGGKSGQIREVQKTSKKINCPATMKANCYKSKPEEIVFTFINDHNHTETC